MVFPRVLGGAVASKAQDSQKAEPPAPLATHRVVGSAVSSDVVLTAASCGRSSEGRASGAQPLQPLLPLRALLTCGE